MSGPPETHPRRYEEDLIPRGKVFGLLALAVLFGGGLCVGAWGIAKGTQESIRPLGRFPEGQLQTTGKVAEVHEAIFTLTAEGLFLQATQRGLLERWEWVDQQKQIVRVPIDEAMRLVAEHEESGPR